MSSIKITPSPTSSSPHSHPPLSLTILTDNNTISSSSSPVSLLRDYAEHLETTHSYKHPETLIHNVSITTTETDTPPPQRFTPSHSDIYLTNLIRPPQLSNRLPNRYNSHTLDRTALSSTSLFPSAYTTAEATWLRPLQTSDINENLEIKKSTSSIRTTSSNYLNEHTANVHKSNMNPFNKQQTPIKISAYNQQLFDFDDQENPNTNTRIQQQHFSFLNSSPRWPSLGTFIVHASLWLLCYLCRPQTGSYWLDILSGMQVDPHGQVSLGAHLYSPLCTSATLSLSSFLHLTCIACMFMFFILRYAVITNICLGLYLLIFRMKTLARMQIISRANTDINCKSTVTLYTVMITLCTARHLLWIWYVCVFGMSGIWQAERTLHKALNVKSQ